MVRPSAACLGVAAFLTLQCSEVAARVIPRSLDLTSLSSSLPSLLNIPSLNSSSSGSASGSASASPSNSSFLSGLSPAPYSLPQNDPNAVARAAGLLVKQAGYLYGPSVAGGPYYPTGALGTARAASDLAEIQLDLTPELAAAAVDAADSTASAPQYNGLNTLHDYVELYDGHFKLTLPKGPDPGVLTNYTQDLLFSMERLSISPYQVRRLNPSQDTLQFTIDDRSAMNITGRTVQQLFQQGRLFYADYRDQKNLTPTLQFAAAVDALFYIDCKSGEFLPLAIRTNVGSNLIYTPLDTPNDWLLAKIMYNVNDFWFAQWNHLAQSHEVVQIVYLAALRTLSESHPVQAVLDRLMYEVYAIQPLALSVLFLPGAAVDQVFPYTGISAQNYATDRYFNKGSGRFVANYFTTELTRRGLINSNYGPPLKNFPFYEDASVIWTAINKFMTSFVNSYYSSDAAVLADREIQSWVTEAQGPAKAIDFEAIQTRAALVDALTHIAHLASTAHHTVNTNELGQISSALPFHPAAIYLPPPTSKGVTNVADYLPKLVKVEAGLAVAGLFARPFFVNTNRTLLHMFDDQALLSRTNPTTEQAAATFQSSMQAFSNQVAARTFDQNGLSQGMPFVWQALDPNVAPYSITT